MATRHRTRPPATVGPAPTREVRIWDPDAELARTIRLRWLCPVPTCRRPRGTPTRTTLTSHSADGTRSRVTVDVWRNPCGHVQLTAELIAEAATLAANGPATAAGGTS